nr:MAG TPA: hypothetical protein [Caudoviricetes sp.]
MRTAGEQKGPQAQREPKVQEQVPQGRQTWEEWGYPYRCFLQFW